MKTLKASLLFAALAASTSLLALASNAQPPSPRQPQSSVLELVRAIDRSEPISQKWLADTIAGELKCTPTDIPYGDKIKHRLDCDAYDVMVGTEFIDHINFRSVDAGSLLILSGLKKQCVPLAKLTAPTDPIVDGCTDGVSCPYVTKHESWGTMSVAARSEGTAQCATQVVFKSGL